MAAPAIPRAEISINREWCKGCNICVAFCPEQVLALDEHEKAVVTALDKCTLCKICELHCPDLAIEVRPAGKAAGPAAGHAPGSEGK
jgi:2-oxoglutarate ferredoxin oxidoreductase subunit delta